MNMPPVPDKTLQWLYTSLQSVCEYLHYNDIVLTLTFWRQEYHDVNRAYSDIAQTLSHYTSLSPRTEVYSTHCLPCSLGILRLMLFIQLLKMAPLHYCSFSKAPSQYPSKEQFIDTPYQSGCPMHTHGSHQYPTLRRPEI